MRHECFDKLSTNGLGMTAFLFLESIPGPWPGSAFRKGRTQLRPAALRVECVSPEAFVVEPRGSTVGRCALEVATAFIGQSRDFRTLVDD